MTTERFRNYPEKETINPPEKRQVREIQEGESMLTSGLGARPAGEDFEDAPLTENPYAQGDVLVRLGDDAFDAHEEAEERHANQEASANLQGGRDRDADLRRRFGKGHREDGPDADLAPE
jgi:hypothetical protein